jgi:hypothetical protein
MREYVYLSEHLPPPDPSRSNNLTMVHFVWPIGNTLHKLNRMTEYTKKLLNNYGSLCDWTRDCSLDGVLNKKFTWVTAKSSGEIRFLDKGVISTSWGDGVYTQYDQYTFNVTWKSFSHILKMDSSDNSYVGLNSNSIESIKGRVIT